MTSLMTSFHCILIASLAVRTLYYSSPVGVARYLVHVRAFHTPLSSTPKSPASLPDGGSNCTVPGTWYTPILRIHECSTLVDVPVLVVVCIRMWNCHVADQGAGLAGCKAWSSCRHRCSHISVTNPRKPRAPPSRTYQQLCRTLFLMTPTKKSGVVD